MRESPAWGEDLSETEGDASRELENYGHSRGGSGPNFQSSRICEGVQSKIGRAGCNGLTAQLGSVIVQHALSRIDAARMMALVVEKFENSWKGPTSEAIW